MRTRRAATPDALSAHQAIEHARLWVPRGMEVDAAGLSPATARAVAVAHECGAPVGPVLEAAAAVASERADLAAALERVVAPAVAVARGLVAVPMVVVPVLAVVLDIDLWHFWTGHPVGRVVGACVAAMVGVAALWLRAMVRRAVRPQQGVDGSEGRPDVQAHWLVAAIVAGGIAWVVVGWWACAVVGGVAWHRMRPHPADPSQGLDEAVDLVAVAVAAGHDLAAALRLAASTVPDRRLGDQVASLAMHLSLVPPSRPRHPTSGGGGWGPDAPGMAPLTALVVDLWLTGAPAAAPLRRLASRLRQDRAAGVRVAVARLPGQLTFPTTLLLVPATVLAIGAPIAMRGLAAISGT